LEKLLVSLSCGHLSFCRKLHKPVGVEDCQPPLIWTAIGGVF
jgi:hypothetical protein